MLKPVALPEEVRALVCEFLLVFSRFEYALKLRGYVHTTRHGRVEVDRRRFSADHPELVERVAQGRLRQRAAAVLERPPARQKLVDGRLEWEPTRPLNPNQLDSGKILDAVYQIRNNLFHGGKWPADPARDPELLRAALAVIEGCLEINDELRRAYFDGSSKAGP